MTITIKFLNIMAMIANVIYATKSNQLATKRD